MCAPPLLVDDRDRRAWERLLWSLSMGPGPHPESWLLPRRHH